ncbi:transcriptional regulator [Dactylosporangium aurantiacum]|uniref:Transcriptional regulator n=1 Tax=Dactylosporangium aurantiacum TaxID=35754 RepID=A0A9Q9MD08_9ACTN|nr:helix-turn-helix transcriptional regulator [Dactylosporangium aurantiacum]MDG6105015.1 helix-turn-helix transcriptional regulator [Dactylosporangium aurantiacum]UWZ51549.1 transcriptional regulator [Dactylosporangium aurantiacum]
MSSSAAIFAALRPVVQGLAQTFGRTCEVVLHDYSDTAHSVVAVGGDVTGRRPGDAMSQIGMRVLAAGDAAVNEVNYLTRAEDGRILRCSTFPLRDADGTLVGALCVNVDVSDLSRAADLLAELSGQVPGGDRLPVTVFSGDLDQVLASVVAGSERETGRPAHLLTRSERLTVIRRLQSAGAFAIRGAPGRIAKQFGISRAALYNDLAAIAEEGKPDAAAE